MGSFVRDTACTLEGNRGTARLSDDWEIWGPAGGYVAAIALRAAGATSRFRRPASCSVQFLGVARFEQVDLAVEHVKQTRRTDAIRVVMTQDDRPILQLTCWSVTDDHLDRTHRFGTFPHGTPEDHPTIEERFAGAEPAGGRHAFWDNLDQRPIGWVQDWEARGPLDPVTAGWYRYRRDPVTDDPWIEAARLLLLVDLLGWPAAHRAHPPELDAEWYAPSLDVSCQFVDLATTEWLCAEHVSPAAGEGLVHAEGSVWADDGRLLARGITSLIATPTRR